MPFAAPGQTILTVGGRRQVVGNAISADVVGQQLITASGAFVVPDGVTSLCAVAIGRGAAGSTSRTGAGGALAYANSLSVTPGESLDVVISAATSSLSRSTTALVQAGAGSGLVGGAVAVGTGFEGGAGISAASIDRQGAGAGGYTSAGQASGTADNANGGGGSSPLGGAGGGLAGGAPTIAGGTYGGGGGHNSANVAGSAGPGCVRIIWGAGRAFPNTNTGDL